eukprot:1195037-Prorocentrum_minimum.AAC.6
MNHATGLLDASNIIMYMLMYIWSGQWIKRHCSRSFRRDARAARVPEIRTAFALHSGDENRAPSPLPTKALYGTHLAAVLSTYNPGAFTL